MNLLVLSVAVNRCLPYYKQINSYNHIFPHFICNKDFYEAFIVPTLSTTQQLFPVRIIENNIGLSLY